MRIKHILSIIGVVYFALFFILGIKSEFTHNLKEKTISEYIQTNFKASGKILKYMNQRRRGEIASLQTRWMVS